MTPQEFKPCPDKHTYADSPVVLSQCTKCHHFLADIIWGECLDKVLRKVEAYREIAIEWHQAQNAEEMVDKEAQRILRESDQAKGGEGE